MKNDLYQLQDSSSSFDAQNSQNSLLESRRLKQAGKEIAYENFEACIEALKQCVIKAGKSVVQDENKLFKYLELERFVNLAHEKFQNAINEDCKKEPIKFHKSMTEQENEVLRFYLDYNFVDYKNSP